MPDIFEFEPRPKTGKEKLTRFEHKQNLNELIKAILLSPMNDDLKFVMLMRVWGTDPRYFKPLSVEKISKKCKVPQECVEVLEKEAMGQMKIYLQNNTMHKIISDFNSSLVNKKKLFSLFDKKEIN